MPAANSISALKKLSDEEIIRLHDNTAQNPVIGISYYLDELRSRDIQRSQDAMEKLTNRIYWLTLVVTVATAVQLFLAFA